MRVGGSYVVPLERQRVYALLLDPDVLCRSMPGCKELAQIGTDEYRLKMGLVISSISGLFDSKIRLADQNPPESFRLIVEGTGKAGFVNGDGLLRLAEQGRATEVSYEGDVHIGGVLASVGQRLLDTAARMLIKRFFEKLSAIAAERQSAAQA